MSLFSVGTETQRIWVLVIAGLGDSDGVMHVLTSATPAAALLTDMATQYTAASVTAHAVLPIAIPIPPQSVGVMDPIGSDSAITVSIPRTAALEVLLDTDGPDYIEPASTAPVTLAEALTAAETDVSVSDGSTWAGASSDAWIWINGECMRVDSRAAAVLTVTRGAMATRAAAHTYVRGYPTYALAALPRVVGARAHLYEGTTATATLAALSLRWTGVCGDIGSVGAEWIDIPIQSGWERLKSRLHRPWLAEPHGELIPLISADGSYFAQSAKVRDAYLGSGAWTYHALVSGDAWWIWQASFIADVAGPDGVTLSLFTSATARPIAAGIGDSILPEARWGEVLEEADTDVAGGGTLVRGHVQWAHVQTNAADIKVSAVFHAILTGAAPSGKKIPLEQSLDLTSDEVDTASLLVLDDAAGGPLTHPGGSHVIVPPHKGSILAWLAKQLKVLGCGLVLSPTGKIQAIDYRQRLISSATLDGSDLTSPAFTTRRRTDQVIGRVILDVEQGAESVETIISAIASSYYQGGRELDIDGNWLAHLCVRDGAIWSRWVRQPFP